MTSFPRLLDSLPTGVAPNQPTSFQIFQAIRSFNLLFAKKHGISRPNQDLIPRLPRPYSARPSQVLPLHSPTAGRLPRLRRDAHE